MPIYSFENESLHKVAATTFSTEGILERTHLQQALKDQIDIIAPDCLVIAEEFSEWSTSQRRIDLLAVDKDGNLVVIELKRNETGEFMDLQAIRYAAMVSTLTFQRAVEIFQKYLQRQGKEESAEERLTEFLGWDDTEEDNFALDVRIILVSSNFSRELTTSVMWLNERSIDIRCVRLIPYKYNGTVLIDVQQIIPLPEAETYQVKIKQQTEERREARKSYRDYTRYLFNGNRYNKRKLVLAVVKEWIALHKPTSLAALVEAFPQALHRGGLFVPLADAQEIAERQGRMRHFIGESDVITFADGSQYALSNQWGKGNLERLLESPGASDFEISEA